MAGSPLGHICGNRQVAYLKQPSVNVAKGQVWQPEVSPESSVLNLTKSSYLIVFVFGHKVKNIVSVHSSLTISFMFFSCEYPFLSCTFIIVQPSVADRKLSVFTTLLNPEYWLLR